MILSRWLIVGLAILSGSTPGAAQDVVVRPLRYGYTSGWMFDGRSDARDFPTNGYFPGNFASYPGAAYFGAAGFLGGNPQHSRLPYPSQVVFGISGQRQWYPSARCRSRCGSKPR